MTVIPYAPHAAAAPESWLDVMDRASALAEAVANTDFVPRGLRGNPPAILGAILYGHAIGLHPMVALATISVIEGRPTLAAEAQLALIRQAGHEVVEDEATITRCTVRGRRRGEQRFTSITWTQDDAKRANLAGKQNWRMYPRQMLRARAIAELARALFSDVIRGLAATEELEGGARELDTVEASTPAPATTTTRRRRRTVAAAPEPEPGPVPASEATSHEGPKPEPQPEPEPASMPSDGEPTPDAAGKSSGPPEPIPPPEPAMMNEAQKRKLFALFGDFGMNDRDTRLRWATQVLGREVASSTELTSTDASRLIDELTRVGGLEDARAGGDPHAELDHQAADDANADE